MSGLTFLSWVRSGPRLDTVAVDPLVGALPTHGLTTIGLRLNQRADLAVPARLYGPGDVTGLDARQVVRVDPAPGAEAAEPAFFPLVEFDRPDLPWLLTPARARDGERLRPWLVLVVAEVPGAVVAAESGAPLPVLRCARRELPDLADSWAWAHAQLATDGAVDADTLDALLAGSPEQTLSRLVRPRRLLGGKAYVACVVPAFEAGRKRGLGIPFAPTDDQRLDPAWQPGPGGDEIALPVYYHWSFATGPEGDFEALVRRLRARPVPDTLGQRPMDVSHVGPGFPTVDPATAAAILGLEGALRGPTARTAPWDATAAAAFRAAVTPLMTRRPGRLGLPLYGGGQADATDVVGAPRWARDLNLDPRHRAAAAYGAEVVRRNQEALMASAWAQAAAAARANDALRQGQLARAAGSGAYRRLAAGAAGLGDERMLQVTAPVHPAVTAAGALAANREVQAVLSPAFRRITRPRGPLARRIGSGAPLAAPVNRLAARDLTVNPVLAPAPGMVALEALTAGERVRDLLASRIKPKWWETEPTQPGEVPAPGPARVLRTGAAMANRLFMVTEDGRVFSRVDSPAGWHDHGTPPGGLAESQPVAIRDLFAFVRTTDGRLCSVGWDGDQWLWQDHGKPNGAGVAGRPLALARDSAPGPGGTQHNGDFQSVFVCAADGHLWERAGFEESWHWIDRGTPPGTTAVGAPGSSGPYDLLVHGGDGHLYRFVNNGDGWTWADYGRPPSTSDTSVPPFGSGGIPFVRTTAGQLGLRYPILGGQWVTLAAPYPISNILGFDNGLWVTSESTGRLQRYWTPPGASASVWEAHDPVAGLRSWATLRSGSPWIAADGELMVRRVSGAYSWDDYGPPVAGGAGAPTAPPPRRPAWRGNLGFMSNLLVLHVDNATGANNGYLRIGRDLGFDGEVRDGWVLKQPGVAGLGDQTQGAGLAMADLNGMGGQDLLLFWVEQLAQGNFGSWRIGWNIGPGGDVSWDTTVRRMPTPMSTTYGSSGALTASYPVLGCDATLADLDGDNRPELVVAYVSGIPDRPRVYYRIGWNVDATGAVVGGWTESIQVPWPGRGPGAPAVQGVGVAVADIDNDLRPELVVMLVESTPGGLQASYMIGRQINGRGRVVGPWSGPHVVGGGPLGQQAQDAAIALADFSGSQSPDLVVFHIENLPTDNRAWYRVGFDLQASGIARRWSEPREVDPGGWWGWENQGAGIAVGDMDNALLARKRQLATNFRTAAAPHQQLIERAQQLARADDEAHVTVAAVADDVRVAIDPEDAVTSRVTGRLGGIDLGALPASVDNLDPLAVAPTFPQPMSEALAELSQDLLLPGVDQVPPDTVTLVRANSRFIEAYMVGLNHEMAREMLWRQFPGDRRATFFRQFWDPATGNPALGALTDIPPVGDWNRDLPLGGHATAIGGPDMVVLLVRGELLRRYPHATVTARRAAWGAGGPGTPRGLTAETMLTQFQGRLPPDLIFFGFPLTVAQARGDDSDPGWFFVLAEHPSAPRFGLDDPAGASFGVAPASWEQLDWTAFATTQTALDALVHAPVATPFAASAPITRPRYRDGHGPSFTWPRNSAHLAHITLQPSVQIAIHASDMLPAVDAAVPATLTAISPATGNQGQTVTATIAGTGLSEVFVAGFGDGITAQVLSADDTSAHLRLTIGAAAALGPRPFGLMAIDWTIDTEATGLTFTVTAPPPYYSGIAPRAMRLTAPTVPVRVELVEPAELDRTPGTPSLMVTFTKEIRWDTLTAATVALEDDRGRQVGTARVEPYPYSPDPQSVSRITVVAAGVDLVTLDAAALVLRLRGTGPDPIRDVDGLALDGTGTGGDPASDFAGRITVTPAEHNDA